MAGDDDWSNSEEHALTIINILTSTISVLGSGFIVVSMIILSYKSYKEDPSKIFLLQLLHFRLVFMLSVSDIMYSLAMFMGDPADGSSTCYFQAIWSNFFELTSVGWVLCIAFTLWQSFVRNDNSNTAQSPDAERNMFLKMWAANWLFALFWTCIPFADGNHYGDSGAWCWIDNSDTGQVMRYFCFYVWLWVAIGLIIFFYYQLMIAIHALIREGQQGRSDPQSLEDGCCTKLCAVIKVLTGKEAEQDVTSAEMVRIMKRLCLYPLILIGCWIFGTINRLQNSFDQHNPSFGLFVMHMLTSNLNGFFNAFVYGYNTTFRQDVKKYCCGWTGSDAPEHESSSHVSSELDAGFAPQEDEMSTASDVPPVARVSEPSGVQKRDRESTGAEMKVQI